MTQAELSLRATSPFPVADFFRILYGNIFKLLEETYFCKGKNENINSICLWNLISSLFLNIMLSSFNDLITKSCGSLSGLPALHGAKHGLRWGNLSRLCNGGGCCPLRLSCFRCSADIAETGLKWVCSVRNITDKLDESHLTDCGATTSTQVALVQALQSGMCPRIKLPLSVNWNESFSFFTVGLGKHGLQKSVGSHSCNPGHNKLQSHFQNDM